MADVTLSDGREITINLGKVTVKEWRALFDPKQPDDEEYTIVGKAAGMTAEQVGSLSLPDWQRLYRAMLKKAQEPLADPN